MKSLEIWPQNAAAVAAATRSGFVYSSGEKVALNRVVGVEILKSLGARDLISEIDRYTIYESYMFDLMAEAKKEAK